ncbi:hypothetical protein BRD01_01575 [Halobacteriales archaeon QS_8_65_32]|nr:MAG: hypothetical protein BRD01_01575 [Halobacteriales archaeon QS_8_65_32]
MRDAVRRSAFRTNRFVPNIQVGGRHPFAHAVSDPPGRPTRCSLCQETNVHGRSKRSRPMSRVLGDGAVTLLVKGFVSVLFAITLLNLIVELQGNGEITALSGALLFVYASGVLAVGVFTDRLFAPRVQIALFSGLTAYWVYDYFSRNNTLSILLVVFGVAVLVQQARRLTR